MAAGDICADIIREIPPVWLYVKYTSGSVEPAPGDTIWGDTSNANAILELLVLSSGTWAGGDAAGWMFLSNWNGTAWTSGENFTKNTTVPANDGTLTATPVSCYASPDTINDVPVADFDSASNEARLFLCRMLPNYASGGCTVKIVNAADVATGDLSYGGAWRSFTDDVDNLLATSFNAWSAPVYNQAITTPTVVGELTYDTIAFTDGAQMDSTAAGEIFLFLLFRDAQDAVNDDAAGDSSLIDIAFTLT